MSATLEGILRAKKIQVALAEGKSHRVMPRGGMELSRHPAAIDDQDVAGDVVGGSRGEEDGGSGDVGGFAPAAGGDAVEDCLAALGIGAELGGVVGGDVA